jgi:hypothetical protein
LVWRIVLSWFSFEFRVQVESVYYPEIIVAKYHGQSPATAINFYDHVFGRVLCKVRANACVICSFDSVSAAASVNLIFISLQKKNYPLVMNRAVFFNKQ